MAMVAPRPSSVQGESLKFGNGNAKLAQGIFTFSLPAGHFCPFAKACLSQADKNTGRITDGPDTEFRCYAANEETIKVSLRASRWHNRRLLASCKTRAEYASLILKSLSPFAGYVRIHTSGDFFNQAYFDAWLLVAKQRPRTWFYGYTKSLTYWVKRLAIAGTGRKAGSLKNFVLTASYGGTLDHLIEQYRLRSVKVVLHQSETDLELDDDDSHAMNYGSDFALLIHGTQPKGSVAGKILYANRREGIGGYRSGKPW